MKSNKASNIRSMKKLFALSSVAVLAACGDPNMGQDLASLTSERDALQVQMDSLEAKINMTKDTVEDERKLPIVSVMTVEKKAFSHWISVQGNVSADKNVILFAQQGGNVKTIHVSEGQQVSAGTRLVSLDTDVINRNIEQVEKQLDLANFAWEKQDKLWQQNIGSELQWRQAKTNKESLEAQLKALKEQRSLSVISAPFAGTVDEILPNAGELVGPGMPVLRLLNLDKAHVEADIPEYYYGKVNQGDPINLEFVGMSHLNMDSLTLTNVGNYVNASNRTIKVRVEFNNVKKLVPNLLADMKIRDYHQEAAVVIPSINIRQDVDGNDFVLLIKDNNIVERRGITPGLNYQPTPESVSYTEVLEGLNGGELLITEGYKKVMPDQAVDVRNQ